MILFLAPGGFNTTAAQEAEGSPKATLNTMGVSNPTTTPPDEDLSVAMARATWDTGWFQAEIFKLLLEVLGYSVTGPQTMDNQVFFEAAARGEVDLWTNSWFPSHHRYLQDPRVKGKVELVGYEVMAGALQGYLIDKKSAEAFGIANLADFKDPDIAKLFDRDGNGKADLMGCNPGWACGQIIEHHLSAYGLNETVEQVRGDYAPLMAETVSRYKQGAPVFFYTWTPNWTIGTLVPGRDVVWLEVPVPSLPAVQEVMEGQIKLDNIQGCTADPCAMGFVPSDIRVVANSAFLARHPAIRRLAENVSIPLDDINAQNARMIAGEDDDDDIRRHAKEWIHQNIVKVDQWLAAARAEMAPRRKPAPSIPAGVKKGKTLRVATKSLAPFVAYRNRRYTGFSIELWDKIAYEIGINYELYGVNTIAKLLDEVRRNAADVAIGGIGLTSRREQYVDFSHPFLESGFQIMVPREHQTPVRAIFSRVFSILFSRELISAVGLFLIALFIAAHIIWLMERRHNPEFSKGYLSGLWQSIWWALVTVTTVGYGDKTPKGRMGRLFGMVWILAGYFVLAYFTASVTSTVTVRELQGTIKGPEDLFGKRVATVKKSPAAEYLAEQGITAVRLPDIETVFQLLENRRVDAVVYDAPVLQHYASQKGRGKVDMVGLIFKAHSYGIALPANSPYREDINTALLRLMERGIYKEIHDRWFGS